MSGGGGYSFHGRRKGVDAGTEVDGNISEPSKLANTSVFQLRLDEVVSREVVGDSKWVESVSTSISVKIGGVGKPRKCLGLLCGERGGSTS